VARERTEITVSNLNGNLRVVVQLPSSLDALSYDDRTRAIHDAMWEAAEAIEEYLRTGSTGARTVTAA
jgi:hypothetical protein